ncbi:MAG: Asp-tRNA(Asn)/Glu-tRNA(Gln) amidotransferase subunit GatA [Magnetococcales bacterium]|nr:Asp-tRNA(Asn)/Glu-tRNA(Gln) amidotransferase subunit GatA [Magnetococcales bacterium]
MEAATTPSDPTRLTIVEAASRLREGSLTSERLTSACLERIGRHESLLHAFIRVDAEGAMAAAREADRRLAREEGGPLTGIPLAQKDIFCTLGVPTTCGSRMLADFRPPYDATVTARLKTAGAVLLGKTNMDEFAMGSSTETSFFGVTRNPWDPDRIPGGSSGGSATAVAARFCLGATGTDTGGSIRQPAALTGITGLKPTYGRVSRYGMIAFASSLDQAGPMTRSVADAALLLQVMAGHDPLDSTSIPTPVPDYTATLGADVCGLTVGIPDEYFGEGLAPSSRLALEAAMAEFERLGIRPRPIHLPHTRYAIPTYYIIAPAEASANLARYDGIRFGHRAEGCDTLESLYCRTRAEGFGAEVRRRIMLGTYVLSSGYYDAYYRRAQRVRRLIADDFTTAFREVDLILTPASPDTAFRIGERLDDPVTMYLSDIYTINANLAGIPALSLPCGFDDRGLPVGLQLLAPPLAEARLLQAGHAYQQVTPWHTRLAELAPGTSAPGTSGNPPP